MKNRKTLLNRLLQTSVDEWGHEDVAAALASTVGSSNASLARHAVGPKLRHREKQVKLTATEQIERAALEGEQKDALLQLAVRYDRKLFLPSVADVREFLIMMGERPIGMKDRKEAFRVLLTKPRTTAARAFTEACKHCSALGSFRARSSLRCHYRRWGTPATTTATWDGLRNNGVQVAFREDQGHA